MKALCPSGSHLPQPEGPPWGAAPAYWLPAHTDTPAVHTAQGLPKGTVISFYLLSPTLEGRG